MLESKLDKIYDKIDDLLRKGHFEKCDQILKGINVSSASTDELLAYLTATLPAASKMPYRKIFYENIEKEIKFRGEYQPEILSGLGSNDTNS